MTRTPTTAAEVTLPDLDEARTVLLLSLGDDELVSGHRASHWTGVAPSIEEDLAFSTIAQDEINHADVWYQLAVGEVADVRAAVDRLGLGRSPDQYRHAVLCERPPRDFAFTLARHWLYDRFDAVRLAALADSSDADIAAVATKLLHEERYHLEHADHWFRRLATGGDEARDRLAAALGSALPEALWLFEPLPGEDTMVAEGLLPVWTAELLVRWLDIVVPMLEEAELADALPGELRRPGEARGHAGAAPAGDGGDRWLLPEDFFAEPGGRHGVHSEDFVSDIWPEMTALYRADPTARW